jgi:hypothetical protein
MCKASYQNTPEVSGTSETCAMREQRCFNGLDVSADFEDPDGFHSYTSSYSPSIASVDSIGLNAAGSITAASSNGSISGVLSAAMVTALNFPSDPTQTQQTSTGNTLERTSEICDKTSHGASLVKVNSADNLLNAMRADPKFIVTNVEPIDFEWLSSRCDGDRQLVLEVLQSFCEQGQVQLSAMQSSLHSFDYNRLMFHAVRFRFLDINFFLHLEIRTNLSIESATHG